MAYIRHGAKRCVICKRPEGHPHAPDRWVAQFTIRRVV
jgi:hypothetical protein